MSTREESKWEKMQHKYRLVLVNDETLEENFTYQLTQLSLYIAFSTLFLVMLVFIFLLIAFTPLKEYVPGYGDVDMRKEIITLNHSTDSLKKVVKDQEGFINNIQKILDHSEDSLANNEIDEGAINASSLKSDSVDLVSISEGEIALRQEIEKSENFDLFDGPGSRGSMKSLEDLYLFSPIKGYVTDPFDAEKDHFGIDVVAPEREPIKAVADGMVIQADWTMETGYVIALQHQSNLISFYKHNSVLLKKVGSFVQAGDVIAIIGSTGEESTGPHLHFEMWYNQAPIDPSEYISFN